MDFAYDQIQEESLPADREGQPSTSSQPPTDLNTEFQQAFKAVSASPWGARLGGFFAQAKKQGESLYSDAQKEYASRSEQAAKVTGELQKSLVESTRNISLAPDAGAANTSFSDPNFALPEGVAAETKGKEKEVQDTQAPTQATRPDSLPADIVKEATSLVSLLRSKAATATANLNLQKIQAAEDAADEALLKFGTGIRSFLRDAVTVTAPSSSSSSTEVLFETNDAEGKRVIHSSRFDAQLHVIHTSPQTFTADPDSVEYTEFAKGFDIAAKTDGIAADLEKYPELRRAMEKLVPEKVEYTVFWTRYYFLRKVIQEEEVRRREVLKGAAQSTNEDLTWDSDSDSDADNEDDSKTATPTKEKATTTTEASSTPVKSTNPTTSTPSQTTPQHEEDIKSVSSTSDTSYDIVSGTTSRAAGSPKDEKSEKAASAAPTKIEEESDEEDWE
ncbi:BSD-domain-containing protein [Aureobasidium sp. EXF-3400]|nr:BSD-domain-containing protein [Aureobasidium sp. EXF-12344]KAI4784986.1 BSD-domain-containing protein [Aureobasidium sp. EXF-3400]